MKPEFCFCHQGLFKGPLAGQELLLWLHYISASHFVSSHSAHQGLQTVIHKNLRSPIENAFLAELLKTDEADFSPKIDPTLSARSIICLGADGFIGHMCEKDMKGKVFFHTHFAHHLTASLPPFLRHSLLLSLSPTGLCQRSEVDLSCAHRSL